MKNHDGVAAVIREWVGKAEEDFTAATLLVKGGRACPTAVVCFHAQQVVEKYLKAVLVARGIAFPKTHNIKWVMALVPAEDRPRLSASEQDILTDYATVARYPGYEPITLKQARQAVAIARRVRGEMRKRLPKESLRKER